MCPLYPLSGMLAFSQSVTASLQTFWNHAQKYGGLNSRRVTFSWWARFGVSCKMSPPSLGQLWEVRGLGLERSPHFTACLWSQGDKPTKKHPMQIRFISLLEKSGESCCHVQTMLHEQKQAHGPEGFKTKWNKSSPNTKRFWVKSHNCSLDLWQTNITMSLVFW